ncbi:MAG: 2-oxo acid dehydrogenase subunit E2 [Clostridia bacterium]|nr:2-oxo acid dehydrogenase subunit E2 [Clostridia bacterium]
MALVRKKGLFDRYDGWRVRNVDTVFRIIPFILRTRVDAQNFFSEDIPIDHIEAFVDARREEIPGLTAMHVFMAALVRVASQRPYINRFVVWNKIYARNHFSISIAIKRSLTDKGEETLIKPVFDLRDTLADVVRRTTAELEANRPMEKKNSSDVASRVLGAFPAPIVRGLVGYLRLSDNVGMMPKLIHKASPWHCSVFFTNIGSLGVGPIYHHLYEFGNCTLFVAMGRKQTRNVVRADGTVQAEKSIGLKFVTDERVCDGHYYAVSMRLLRKLLAQPELLLLPPSKVIVDDGVKGLYDDQNPGGVGGPKGVPVGESPRPV